MSVETAEQLFATLLSSRGLNDKENIEAFLCPSYERFRHDPFLLRGMEEAVARLCKAIDQHEVVYVYGDYDIDGLAATTILYEALRKFGMNVKTFIPDRFRDGYGLSMEAVRTLADLGATLIVTVDCGSLSFAEIELANTLGIDVIVTDHHSLGENLPSACAIINPKRSDNDYPFNDLPGCGVAFKLVQALQTRAKGLDDGQEKWMLDLVALGTVCDSVALIDENRSNVYWGLKVFTKTRRSGLKALVAVAGKDIQTISVGDLSFIVGPHLNAAGRMETATLSLNLLTAENPSDALNAAYRLSELNTARRSEQDRILQEAKRQAENYHLDSVLVLSDQSWSHGIIGIVASKILEQYHKPTFILQEMGELSKGSARSFGDFNLYESIVASAGLISKGGGHKLAAGLTLPTSNIDAFRKSVNDFYRNLALNDQLSYLEPTADVEVDTLGIFTTELTRMLTQMEPFGQGNPEPVFMAKAVEVVERNEMGTSKQHLKLHLMDRKRNHFVVVGFNMSSHSDVQSGDVVDVWFNLLENEWRGIRTAEGRLLKAVLSS